VAAAPLAAPGPLKSLQGFGIPAESYGFANKQLAWETIAPLLDRARSGCRRRGRDHQLAGEAVGGVALGGSA